MSHLLFLCIVLLTAILFALLEIQIEGPHGWAKQLPTWKKSVNIAWLKFAVSPSKPITGYHLYLFTLIFLLLHVPYIFQAWSLSIEYKVITFYLLITTFEDFFWFVLNPAYGLKKFQPRYIPWHRTWIYRLPLTYYFKIAIAVICYSLAYSS